MLPARRVLACLVALVAIAVLSACRVDVAVDTVVAEDGSGTIAIGVGLDDKALTRAGDLDHSVYVDDMRATGWVFTPSAREADGLTWLRGVRRFATLDEAKAVLASLDGVPGGFDDFTLDRSEGLGTVTWTMNGTVDLSRGLDTFADPELASALNDSFGGQVQVIEQQEGRKAADMVNIRVGVRLPDGEPQSFSPKLGDPTPLRITASSQQRTGLPLPLVGGGSGGGAWLVLAGLAMAAVLGLAMLRRRFRAVGP